MWRLIGLAVETWLVLSTAGAAPPAGLGLAVLAGPDGKGSVTVFYPSAAPAAPAPRGPFTFEAEQGRWLLPRFHIERIGAACARCEMIADLPTAGHGSLFSPWPDSLTRSLTPLLVDPPGFDRAGLPAVYATITAFFVRHVEQGR